MTLLDTEGVGAATIRSLSLLTELIYDAPASHLAPAVIPVPAAGEPRKWADYSYAHGGNDAHPFPVDRDNYDRSIAILTDAIRKSRAGETDKAEALKRLAIYQWNPL